MNGFKPKTFEENKEIVIASTRYLLKKRIDLEDFRGKPGFTTIDSDKDYMVRR